MEAPTKDQPKTPQSIHKDWITALDRAEKDRKTWVLQGRKIVKRYRANSTTVQGDSTALQGSKFNLFWANIETLGPATYSRRPKVQVSRRYHDQDPSGRLASLILERALQYEIDRGLNFHSALKQALKDRLLPGMGVAWVRYEPKFKQQTEEMPAPTENGAPPTKVIEQSIEVLDDEFTPVDYVFWEDFLCSPARSWTDVRWVSRKLMFSKDMLASRFGESYQKFGGDIHTVPCKYDPADLSPEQLDKTDGEEDKSTQRALVYEIWDKETHQLIWICRDCEAPLDLLDDPAKLQEFFPCPPPLLATTSNEQFLPVADFLIYQDQQRELDEVSRRISILTKALRVVGVYDASQPALAELLRSARENEMIAVTGWGAFADKGGLKNSIELLPLDQIVKVLQGLYESRETLKQTIYEITGMADIVRGQSVASETLGAQQIKAKFANLRLSSRQQQVAEFVTLILQIKAELMCTTYSPETLKKISAADLMTEVQEHPERLEEALALLKDENTRTFRIEVVADSMVELDQADEQNRATEFMSGVSNFMLAAKNIGEFHPAMLSVVLQMLKFVIRGFSVGRSLEAAIEDAETKILEELANPPEEKPDPTVELKKEIEGMKQEGETARVQMKLEAEERMAGMQQNLEQQSAQMQQGFERERMAREEMAREGESQRAHAMETRKQEQAERQAEMKAQQEGATQQSQQMGQALQQVIQQVQALAAQMQELAKMIQKPRVKTPHYDAEGNITKVTESVG